MFGRTDLTVIIVTYNSAKTIKVCLDSIIRFANGVRIIIIDNNSSDETKSIVKEYGAKVHLIESTQNWGFSRANNIGASRAKTPYLVFLNPDTRLLKADSLEKLVEVLKNNSAFGVIGPKLIYPESLVQARVRNLPTITRAFTEYILGRKGVYDFYQPEGDQLTEVESVIGACMVISKNLFEKAGGFDERYFMYYEDLDLCKTVRKLGFKIGFLPEVVIEHAEGVSGQNQKTTKLMKESAKIYFGFVNYSVLELIFIINRILNKIRKIKGSVVSS